jgi:hypothetical protein
MKPPRIACDVMFPYSGVPYHDKIVLGLVAFGGLELLGLLALVMLLALGAL